MSGHQCQCCHWCSFWTRRGLILAGPWKKLVKRMISTRVEENARGKTAPNHKYLKPQIVLLQMWTTGFMNLWTLHFIQFPHLMLFKLLRMSWVSLMARSSNFIHWSTFSGITHISEIQEITLRHNKIFFTVRVIQLWNRLPRKALFLKILKTHVAIDLSNLL